MGEKARSTRELTDPNPPHKINYRSMTTQRKAANKPSQQERTERYQVTPRFPPYGNNHSKSRDTQSTAKLRERNLYAQYKEGKSKTLRTYKNEWARRSNQWRQIATMEHIGTRAADSKITKLLGEAFGDSLDLLDYLLTAVDSNQEHSNKSTITKPTANHTVDMDPTQFTPKDPLLAHLEHTEVDLMDARNLAADLDMSTPSRTD